MVRQPHLVCIWFTALWFGALTFGPFDLYSRRVQPLRVFQEKQNLTFLTPCSSSSSDISLLSLLRSFLEGCGSGWGQAPAQAFEDHSALVPWLHAQVGHGLLHYSSYLGLCKSRCAAPFRTGGCIATCNTWFGNTECYQILFTRKGLNNMCIWKYAISIWLAEVWNNHKSVCTNETLQPLNPSYTFYQFYHHRLSWPVRIILGAHYVNCSNQVCTCTWVNQLAVACVDCYLVLSKGTLFCSASLFYVLGIIF